MLRHYCSDCDDNVYAPDGLCYDCGCEELSPTRDITIRQGYCADCGDFRWSAEFKGADEFRCTHGHLIDTTQIRYKGGVKINDFYSEGHQVFQVGGCPTVYSRGEEQRVLEAAGLSPEDGMTPLKNDEGHDIF